MTATNRLADTGRIGRYTDLHILGQGGMGAVYRGRDPELDRKVAIKVMLDATPDFVARFRREAQSIAKLVHPHIVQVYDFGVDEDGNPYFVMELIDGKSLDRLVRERGPIPPTEAVALIRQAADGLGAAHKVGIIHRDVKPSNLVVDENGVVKLVDFGIARVTQAGTALTGAAALMGTPGYMAPEQAAGKSVDHRADIYALGLTLYEVLAGRPPYEGEDAISLVVKNMQEPLPDLRMTDLGLPEELVTLVEQMSAKDPNQRLQTMDAVQAALDDVLARLETGQWQAVRRSSAVGAVPPTNVHSGAPAPRSGLHPLVLGAAGLLLAGVGVGAFFMMRPKVVVEQPKVVAADATKNPPVLNVKEPSRPGPTTQNANHPDVSGGPEPGLTPKNDVVNRPGLGSTDGPLRVAVLKFKNLSKETDLNQLEKGVGETAVNTLVGTKGVSMVERNDIESDMSEIDRAGDFHFNPLTVAKLGELKGLEVAIQGGVQKAGKQIRITARFVRVQNGEVLDTVTVNHKAGDVFGAQDEVAKQLGTKLTSLALKEGRK